MVNSFLKNLSSIILGLAVGGLVAFFIESLGHEIFTSYEEVPNIDEKTAFEIFVKNLPVGAFMLLLLSHSLGTLIASYLATMFSGKSSPVPGLAVGGIMLTLSVVNFISIQHPTWFLVTDLAIYFPAALIGYKFSILTSMSWKNRAS